MPYPGSIVTAIFCGPPVSASGMPSMGVAMGAPAQVAPAARAREAKTIKNNLARMVSSI